ncbi:MAG TPA: APC family permease, partial [Tepidisphaeraceae bacterium]|nr:APC family permease [Tepidisphaeraceae bacterium]
RCLTSLETLAQSIAVIAPSASTAAIICLAFVAAGNATWLSYLFAGIGLALVGLNVNQFAKRSASPGSLYSYTSMALGPAAGVMVGWGWLVAYVGCGIALAGAAANFMLLLFHSPTAIVWSYITYTLAILIPWYVAYRDIKLSARLMLVLEFTSMALIGLLVIGVFARTGMKVYVPQITLSGFTAKGFFLAIVLAVFCNIGFESSTSLGEEAKNPLKTIPRAVILATVVASTFYVFSSFAIVGGFAAAGVTLDGNADELGTLTSYMHMSWLGPIMTIMVLVSALGCTLGSFNAACRIMFAMGHHGVIHKSVAGAHKTHETPHVSVTVCAAVSLFIGYFMMAYWQCALTDILNDVSTMSSYGFLVGFVLICIAAPVYLKRLGKLTAGAMVISILGLLFMVVPIVGSFYPLPDPPIRYYPYIFAGYLAVGVVFLFIQRGMGSGVLQKIETDLEGIAIRYGSGKEPLMHAEVTGVAEPKPTANPATA